MAEAEDPKVVATINGIPVRAMPKQQAAPDSQCDRLTVLLQLTHEQCGQDPTQIRDTFHDKLASSEQPYIRRMKIGAARKPLDCGWVVDRGYIVIQNKSETSVVYFYVGAGLHNIRPGHFYIGEPGDGNALQIQASDEDTPVVINIFGR